MISKLAKKLMDEETEARLINWGMWLMADNTYQKLNYPSKAPFTVEPTRGSVINDNDGEWIAHIVSTLSMSNLGRAGLYAFVLRVEFVDAVGKKTPHVSQRAAKIRKHFKKSCAESTYYKHLGKAKELVQLLAGPIVQ
jgi:hypothetical protein